MTKAEDWIASGRVSVGHPQAVTKFPGRHKERITIGFPGPVELRAWSDPTADQDGYYITVEPKEDETHALTTADVAALLGTTAQRLRRVLRAKVGGVGSGQRYDLSSLTTEELAALRAEIDKT